MSIIAWHYVGIGLFGGAWLLLVLFAPEVSTGWLETVTSALTGSLLGRLGVPAASLEALTGIAAPGADAATQEKAD